MITRRELSRLLSACESRVAADRRHGEEMARELGT